MRRRRGSPKNLSPDEIFMDSKSVVEWRFGIQCLQLVISQPTLGSASLLYFRFVGSASPTIFCHLKTSGLTWVIELRVK